VKKVLILIFILLFSNNANSKNSLLEEKIPVGSTKKHMCWAIMDNEVFDSNDLWCHGLKEKYYTYFPSQNTEIITIKNNRGIHFVFENVTKRMNCFNLMCKKGTGTLRRIAYSKQEALDIANNQKYKVFLQKLENKRAEETQQKQEAQQEAIMFTIKDKREQCEAIGFKPETEKFADCVLRLVELDVKKQQSNKIANAQNSGNDALVKQLQRQQYDRGTDALLNLGQQLLNPRTTNSNIYMPQTQRCTIQGFGTFAKIVCR